MTDKEYATNPENGHTYELKPDKYKQYPHLQVLKKEIEDVVSGSKEYWKLRCNFLYLSVGL